MNKPLVIGIDPGVNTGLSWHNKETSVLTLTTVRLHEGFDKVKELKSQIKTVIIENPNLWTHFKSSRDAKSKLQGAGSVKRDFSAWIDFLDSEGIPYKSVRPDKIRNAWATDANKFKQITGYSRRSSEHARVAGLIAFLNSN